jgi:carboxymethylenebutenolidase
MEQNIIKERVIVSVQDGSTMSIYVARPEGTDKLPVMLVFQEAFGVNAHIRDITERIASEGYVALAPELFHRTAPGFEGSYTDFESVRQHMQALTIEDMQSDMKAAYNYAQSLNYANVSLTGAIGFCMGGRVAFLASAFLPLKAATCFYGGGMDTLIGKISGITCPVLLCWGGLDKHIPKEKIDMVTQALTEKEKDFINVVFSKADHGFFCDARASCHPNAAVEAWELVKAFWKQNLKQEKINAHDQLMTNKEYNKPNVYALP